MGCGASTRPAHVARTLSIASDLSIPSTERVVLRACKYGAGCYQRNAAHLSKFAHPGDRNYRIGRVEFEPYQKPEFQNIWQLFSFYDPEETGYLEKDDFAPVYEFVLTSLVKDAETDEQTENLDTCWTSISQNEHLNFSGLVAWMQELGCDLPVGVSDVNELRPCRFKLSGDGERCSCPNYTPAEDGFLCTCGHKPSMHRSDAAEASAGKQTFPPWWLPDAKGLVEIEDETLMTQLQGFLDSTHKKDDNWTRDRGCTLHGRHDVSCSFHCANTHRVPVPRKYVLRLAFRNQNQDLWTKYSMMRNSIATECASHSEYKEIAVEGQSLADLDSPLVQGCNEWRLLHGTSFKACLGICASNFRLSLAGTGATWKDPGKETGSPLYGYGIYLAERVTKADEYSEEILHPDLSGILGVKRVCQITSSSETLFCMLVVRCVGGQSNLVTTNDIDKDKLKEAVFDGPNHSVFGDRVVSLGKPYREIVVYDKDQCYPDFLLIYERC